MFEAVQYPFWAWEAGNSHLPGLLTYLTHGTISTARVFRTYLGTEYGSADWSLVSPIWHCKLRK